MLIYDYLKFRKDPSITSQEVANYISFALAVALSVNLRKSLENLTSMIFSKTCNRFRKVGYNLNLMRHTAYLDSNPIMLDSYTH